MTSSALLQLARWRRVRSRRDAGLPVQADDATWLADVCRDVVDGGKPLRAAFGLPARGGAGNLATVAKLAGRDALLRDVRRTYFPGMGPREAARAILASTRLGKNSRQKHPVYEVLRETIASGDLPGERQLARIIRDIQTGL